jgi:hypothetical protein
LIVRDCLIENSQNFLSGDTITIYGECAGTKQAYDSNYAVHALPSINMAYVIIE